LILISSGTPILSNSKKKLSSAIGLLSRIRLFVDTETLRSLYFSLFHSHLSYGSIVWGLTKKEHLKKLVRLQKRAIRTITFADFKEPTSPLFQKLAILKLEDAIKMKQYEFIYEWKTDKLPPAFRNYFTYNEPVRNTRLAATTQLIIPRRQTETYGSTSMKYQGALLHNALLSREIDFAVSKPMFVTMMKTLFLSAYG
jgi:hypothetical protein